MLARGMESDALRIRTLKTGATSRDPCLGPPLDRTNLVSGGQRPPHNVDTLDQAIDRSAGLLTSRVIDAARVYRVEAQLLDQIHDDLLGGGVVAHRV